MKIQNLNLLFLGVWQFQIGDIITTPRHGFFRFTAGF